MTCEASQVMDVLQENRSPPGRTDLRDRFGLANVDDAGGESGLHGKKVGGPLGDIEERGFRKDSTEQTTLVPSTESALGSIGKLRPASPSLPPRPPSPTHSTSSSFSGATTSAALSSRASLSSCRSSFRCSGGSTSRSFSRPIRKCPTSDVGYFPAPARRDNGGRRDGSRRYFRSDRYGERESSMSWEHRRCRRRSSYRSGEDRSRSRTRGWKRSRSGSRERRSNGLHCTRCLEWCKFTREPKKITRTLPMEYWVRTPECKAAKSNHMDYIDRVAYSREQFIEETVFTCPFTGVQRDVLLERNMFPYDVPTDVEHWTLWSRHDLKTAEMEDFVQKWVSENHPHVVEWECDNNEGDRSIDWYHVHVFFRLDCTDNSGARRDPASVYKGPCGTPPIMQEDSQSDVELTG